MSKREMKVLPLVVCDDLVCPKVGRGACLPLNIGEKWP